MKKLFLKALSLFQSTKAPFPNLHLIEKVGVLWGKFYIKLIMSNVLIK